MSDKSVIIIGAGLAGLSAGCFGRMNGCATRIFEHRSVPGGVAAAWTRGDYLIDGGIHFLMSWKPGNPVHDLYRTLGVFDSNRVIEMKTYMSFVDQKGNSPLQVTNDLDRLASDLKSISPADSVHIDEFINAAKAMRGFDMGASMADPPELAGLWGSLKQTWQMRSLIKFVTGKFGKSVAEYTAKFSDPGLRDIINNLFLPEVPVWFVLWLLASLADGQLGMVEGGSLDFVKAIEKRYKSLGGDIKYKATVEKILVEDNRAVGVQLTDGSTHRADIIVSAADGRSTIFGMLEGKYINNKIKDRYADWKTFRPIIQACYGVAREFPGEPSSQVVKLAKPLVVAGENRDWIFLRIFNFSDKFAPQGKTALGVIIETQWDYWKSLREKDRDAYNKEKERISAEVLDRLEMQYPGLSSQVEVTDISTPYTTWRHTLNHRGAFEGFLITPQNVYSRVEKSLPGLDNFYMAGQWVMPGGGVVPCLFSGRHVIQLQCRKDGKSFREAR